MFDKHSDRLCLQSTQKPSSPLFLNGYLTLYHTKLHHCYTTLTEWDGTVS